MSNDSTSKTVTVAFFLCLVCSVVVSTAAVVLRPAQLENKAADLKKNILAAANIWDESKSIDEQFENIEARLVNVSEARFATESELDEHAISDVSRYDERKAAKDSSRNVVLSKAHDIASIKRRAKFVKVYLVRDTDGALNKIILPVSGYGLWSTLYGFIALESDLNTVVGLGFYEHAETPGLGGEVDNPKWKSIWPGKKVYDDQGQVALGLVKASVDRNGPNAMHEVDGLAGASLTSRGVTNLVRFWLGENGYEPFLKNLKQEGV
ncbi:MAG: Na(+)-translocating NADH-quinone reductase subunit C [Gammaproteobacteria bacterium]|nr:MAG: Na(+)-translocating NADH-quinone reductase subunit C [Gammaproteobacteria bacterium]